MAAALALVAFDIVLYKKGNFLSFSPIMQENEVLWPFNEMKFALKSLLWKRIEKFKQV